jgi:hypothetical protein
LCAQRHEPRLGPLEQRDQLLAHRPQLAARRGRLEAASARLEEREAERIGELLELGGDGGLREMQLFGGASHAAQPRDRFENHELREESVPEIPAQA